MLVRHTLRLLPVLAVFLLAGCNEREPIRHYTVEKPPALAPADNPHGENPHAGMTPPASSQKPPTGEPTDRTLAAIVPLTPQGWFFKLSGPIDAVADQEVAFTDFLKSVKFGTDGKPTWTLPEGWQQQPGNQFRYATLLIPGGAKPLELSVTALPNTGDDNAQYILANVNRWRGQLQMPPLAAAELPAESTEVELDGGSATVVNLAGHAAAGGMSPPFFSGAQDGN